MKSKKNILLTLGAVILVFGSYLLLVSNKDITLSTQVTTDKAREERIEQIRKLQAEQGSNQLETNTNTTAVTPIEIGSTNEPQYLFELKPGIETTLTGFYKQYGFYDDMEGEDVVCHGFEITKGDSQLINHYKTLVSEGNTVNTLSESGNLIINLGWNDIQYADKISIAGSTETSPVTIAFEVKDAPKSPHVGSCYDFLKFGEILN